MALSQLYGSFLWMVFNCIKAIEPLQGDRLFSTTKSPGVHGTHFMEVGRKIG